MPRNRVPCLFGASLLVVASHLAAQDGPNLAGGGAALVAASATAQLLPSSAAYNLVIVHVNTPGHPTNLVPGLGVAFKPGGITTAFGRPISSGGGAFFGINVETNQGTTLDDVLLVNGVVVMQEGSPTPWAGGLFNVGTIDEDFGLNDAGDILIGNNTSSTVNDDDIALFQGGTWTLLAQEAGLVDPLAPGLVGGPLGTWDDTLDTVRISNLGLPMWRATGIDGLSTGTTNDGVLLLGPLGSYLQKGVSVPAGQAGGATNAWENFDLEDLYVSPNGAVVLVQGDLLGATTSDDVVTVNDVVVVQEGVVLAGSAFAEPVDGDGIVKAWVDRGGSYYVRGNNDVTETDWVYRNGIVVAESSGTNEVVPGSGEFWDDATFADCFFAFDGNSLGQFVVGGVTSAPADTNGVIVFDDGQGYRRVLVREGDPVDLDGNGLFDDNRFINTFGNDDVLLLDDGTVIFTATLRALPTGTTSVDQGLFRLQPRSASCTLRNGTGISPLACTCATPPALGTTWNIDVSFGPTTVATAAFAAAFPAGPFPIFNGELLIDPVSAVSIPGNGTHPVPLPFDVQFLGLEFFVQGIRLDLNGVNIDFQITNAQDAVIGL